MRVDHETGRDAFVAQLHQLVGVATELTDRKLLAASRCHGWTVAEVLQHVQLGVQEMLLGIVSPTEDPATVDAAGYWGAGLPPDSGDDIDHVRYVRLLVSAYRRPHRLVQQLADVGAVVGAAAQRMPEGRLAFQGHVITSGDFLATWAVELAVHQLDLNRELTVPDPEATALSLSRTTVEELAGGPLPASLSDVDAVLIGTGRIPPPTGVNLSGLRLPAFG